MYSFAFFVKNLFMFEVYKEKRKPNMVMICLAIFILAFVSTYIFSEIKKNYTISKISGYNATPLVATMDTNNIISKNESDTTKMLNEAIDSIVGISKVKTKDSSIFSKGRN
jgi:hypothetical protein